MVIILNKVMNENLKSKRPVKVVYGQSRNSLFALEQNDFFLAAKVNL